MPRLVCFGKHQPDSWKGRIGKVASYKIGSVQSVRGARYRVVCLPHTGLDSPSDVNLDTVALELDGALDIGAAEDDESYGVPLRQLAEQIRQRHNTMVVLHGLHGTGATDALRVVFRGAIEGARKHIETSTREARAARDDGKSPRFVIPEERRPAAQSPRSKSEEDDEAAMSTRSESDPFAGFGNVNGNGGAPPRPNNAAPRRTSVQTGSRRASTQRSRSKGNNSPKNTGGAGPVVITPHPPMHSPSGRKKSNAAASPPATPNQNSDAKGKAVPQRLANTKRPSVSFTSIPDFQTPCENSPSSPVAAGAQQLQAARGQRRLQSVQVNLQRKVSLASFPQQTLNARPESPETMKTKLSGGRHGNTNVLIFTGPSEDAKKPAGHVQLPEFVALRNHCNQCMIDCWIKTSETQRKMGVFDIADVGDHSSCRFAVHMNVDVYDDPKPAALRIQIRDARHTLLEGHVVHEQLFDGNWHLVQFHVVNAKENLLEIRVDGMPCRMTLSSQSDHPYLFETWEQHGVLGGELAVPVTVDSEVLHPFEGQLAEFRVWEMSRTPALLVGHVRLDEHPITDLVSHKQGDVVDLSWGVTHFPHTAMKFSGFNFVNVGTLGGFGGSLKQCGVELFFRTIESKRPMALMKIRDPQKKHMMFGITLNQHGDKHEKGALTLVLRDTLGAEMVAVFEPKGATKLCDGQWHSLQWHIHDVGLMTLYIDGSGRELNVLQAGNPRHFMPFSEFMPIGAFNNRGSVQDLFDGMIRNVVITDSDGIVGCWCLDEGPGSRIAVDSGDPMWQTKENGAYFQHGVYKTLYPTVNSIESKVRRASQAAQGNQLPTQAAPHHSKNPTDWIKCEIPDMEHYYGAMKRQQDKVEVAGHINNIVKIACLAVEPSQKAGSQVHLEALRDVKNDVYVDLRPSDFTLDEKDNLRDHVTLEELPESVWTRCESTDTLLQFFAETMKELEKEGATPGHHMWILSLGGAHTVFVDLAGIVHPPGAKFDARTGQWFSAMSSMGHAARQTACLNKGGHILERAVQSIGSFPMLWLRNTNQQQKLQDLEVWEESLVTRILKSYGLLSGVWSHMCFIHSMAPNKMLSKTELAYTERLLGNVEEAQKKMASSSLTKLVNRASQRMRGQAMRRAITKQMEFRRRSTLLIQRNPSAGMKSVRTAIVLCSWAPQDKRFPADTEIYDNAAKMVDVLAKQKFNVVFLTSQSDDDDMLATEKNLAREVRVAVDNDAMLFVYACCRSGGATYFLPACPLVDFYDLNVAEDAARSVIDAASAKEMGAAQAKLQAAIDADNARTQRNSTKRRSVTRDSARQRVQAHTGGAGLVSKKLTHTAEEDENDETNIMIRLAGERSKVQADETPAREFIAGEQDKQWRLLMKIIAQTQKRYIQREQAPQHLLMDDTKLETNASNVLSVDKLKSMVMPFEPVVGVHRVLAVEGYEWKREQGFYAFHASSGEHIKGRYAAGAHGIATNVLVKGLRGDAHRPDELTGELLDNDKHVSLSQLYAHTSRLMNKYARQKPSCVDPHIEENKDATLVGEATVCTKILRTRDAWVEQKRIDKTPTAVPRGFWMEVVKSRHLNSLAPDGTTGKNALTSFGELLTKALGEQVPEGVTCETLYAYTQPILDVVLNIPYEDLTPRQIEHYKTTVASNLCRGMADGDYEVIAFPTAGRVPPGDAVTAATLQNNRSPAPPANRKPSNTPGRKSLPGGGAVQKGPAKGDAGRQAAPVSAGGECTTIRIQPARDNSDMFFMGDPRYLVPERLRIQDYKSARMFAETLWQSALKGALKVPLRNYHVDLRMYVLAKLKAPPTVAWRLQKTWKAGQHLPLAGMQDYYVSAGGTFTNEEIAAFERSLTEENERAKKATLYNRKRQERQGAMEKNRQRAEKLRDEQRKQINLHLQNMADASTLTQNSLDAIFALIDPDVLVRSCSIILDKVDAPCTQLGTPATQAAYATDAAYEGRHYMSSAIELGLLGMLQRILEAGTLDGEGQDDPKANSAIYKLLAAVCTVCPREYAAHVVAKDVRVQLRRHRSSPGVVRWAVAILYISARRHIGDAPPTGNLSKTAKPHLDELWQVTMHSLASVASAHDAASLAQCFTALLYAFPHLAQAKSLDDDDMVTAAHMALHTIDWCSTRGAQAIALVDIPANITAKHALSSIACDAQRLLTMVCTAAPDVEPRVLYQALERSSSPYDVMLERLGRVGPGVMLCSLCGERFTRQTAEDDECASSKTAAKKHAGPQADNEDEYMSVLPEDNDTNVPKKPASPFPALAIVKNAVAAAHCVPETLVEILKFLTVLLDRDRKIQAFAQTEILQHPAALCELVDMCCALGGTAADLVRAPLINLLWSCFVDRDDAAASPCATQLKSRASSIAKMTLSDSTAQDHGLSPTCLPLVESVLGIKAPKPLNIQ